MAEWLGVRQVAERLGVSVNRIYVATATKVIPSKVSAGGKLRYRLADVEAFQHEEVIRRAKREREKVDAAIRIARVMAERRAKDRS